MIDEQRIRKYPEDFLLNLMNIQKKGACTCKLLVKGVYFKEVDYHIRRSCDDTGNQLWWCGYIPRKDPGII